MSRWFRAYDDAVDDPKLQRLPGDLFKALFNLWCLTSKGGGVLPPIDEIAFKLRMKVDRARRLIETLRQAGLIEDDETGMHPHNWNGRQFKSDVSNERVKRHRERKCNVTDAVTVTPPDTETDTDSETEKKEFRPKRVRTVYSEDFENGFWKGYPRTPIMSKVQAFNEWKRLSEEEKKTAIAAVPRFVSWLKSKPDHPAVHACRFLSQRRFDGFSAPPTPTNTEPVWMKPPPGARSHEEIIAAMNGVKHGETVGAEVRRSAGMDESRAGHGEKLRLSSGDLCGAEVGGTGRSTSDDKT